MLARVPFARDREALIAGIPIGSVTYRLLDRDGRDAGSATFLFGGGSKRVVVAPVTAPVEKEEPAAELLVAALGLAGKPARILVIRDGAIVAARSLSQGDPAPSRFLLRHGEYRVFLHSDGRVGTAEVRLAGRTASAELRASAVAESIEVFVTRSGQTLAGAEISLQGFGASMVTGLRVLWSATDKQGRAVLNELPQGYEGLTLTVIADGSGRTYFVPRSASSVRIDLDHREPGR